MPASAWRPRSVIADAVIRAGLGWAGAPKGGRRGAIGPGWLRLASVLRLRLAYVLQITVPVPPSHRGLPKRFGHGRRSRAHAEGGLVVGAVEPAGPIRRC